ncbi:VWA domain-containing protein [Thermodesulfobacteriota bacterium]
MKRSPLNVFSLSFLDCITCGLGAIILLFVIINAKSAVNRKTVVSDLRAETSRMEMELLEGQRRLVDVKNTLEETDARVIKTQGLSRQFIETIRKIKAELAHEEKENLARRAHINRLKADLKTLDRELRRLKAGAKKQDELGSKLISFPGEGDRQYLTDLKMGGKRLFILVDASASMLDETVIGVIRRRNMGKDEKRKSPKWQRVVKTIDWLVTQLPPAGKFQVYWFNEKARPLVEDTEGRWLNAGDVGHLNQVVASMHRLVPEKGTSLLNAFEAIKDMTPPPDNVFLLVDSLPTMGAGKPWLKRVSGKKRLSLFRKAVQRLPGGIPVNIILYSMEGDPMAADAFWRLAKIRRGSFFCPSKDWP